MTDEQIIKALECCIAQENCEKVSCEICPYDRVYDCKEVMLQNTLDLIYRQKAEIEKLGNQNTILLKSKCKKINAATKVIKSEAIKEFAERLKEELRFNENCNFNCYACFYKCKDYIPAIDNLAKK